MAKSNLTRREFLGAGLAGGAGLFLASCGSPTVHKAASTRPAGSDLGAVDHVVFLMQENRSFDHYFGSYKGVRGFNDHPSGQPGVFAQSWPSAPSGHSPAGRLEPFHLATKTSDAECTFDLTHNWGPQHQCWNGGRMDRFVSTHTSAANEGPSGVVTMGYYTRQDLAFYYALADAFTICDGYHCSVLGPTHPNRLFSTSATIDPAGQAGGPVLTTNLSNSAKFSASWPTMPEALQDKGVSWKVYNPAGSGYQPTSSTAMLLSDNILLYFKQFSDPSSALYKNAFGSTYPKDFAADVASDSLPQVSWLVAPVAPRGLDEHPPAPPALGEYFVHGALQTLASNPKVWAKTVMFVMHDENDGFFDHVPPPTPPAGTAGEYVTVSPLPSAASGIAGPIGLGMRVPMLVLSPFARGGYVNSDTFDHTSQLRFLETRFGVRVPNLSSWRRGVTGDLTTTLHPQTPDRSVPSLPSTPANPPVVARECSAPQIDEINVKTTPYPVPSAQHLPTQEPGSPRRLPASKRA